MTLRPLGGPVAGERLLNGREEAVLAELSARLPGVTPEWSPASDGDWTVARGPGAALARIVARYLDVLGQRYRRATAKRELAFLSLAGLRLVAPSPAMAPVSFQLQDKASDTRVPAGTRLTASAGPGQSQPASFETDTDVAVAAAKLAEVVSFWPGRDQYIDHSADSASGRPFHPFRKSELNDTPHAIYLAHDRLLALSGAVTLIIDVEFSTAGSRSLAILWEYWDGQVWRTFKDLDPSCRQGKSIGKDGTQGFTRNGPIALETDFAETGATAVNGITSHWVRARLLTPLPAGVSQLVSSGRADSAQVVAGAAVLPEIYFIEMSLQIKRALPPLKTQAPGGRSGAGATPPPDPNPNEPESVLGKPVIDKGLPLEKAFADRTKLDVTKTFSPFGPQPQPGSTFAWMIEEVMTKPGAIVTLEFKPALTPQHQSIAKLQGGTSTPLKPVLEWEYWDGQRWSPLEVVLLDDAGQPDANPPRSVDDKIDWGGLFLPKPDQSETAPVPSKRVRFRVPSDAGVTKLNDVEGRWVRIRLAGGGFGVVYQVTTSTTPPQTITSIIVDPPALEDLRVGYVWQFGPFPPERVLTHNDFRYSDETEKALWQGLSFPPFRPPGETSPTLYLGFDKPLPRDRIGIYFDVEEVPDDGPGPPLAWEYWDGFNWRELPLVDDRTQYLRVPGLVNLLGPSDSAALNRFGTPRHWLRARLREDGPPGEPTVARVALNAVDCIQRETIRDEPLGSADGRPGLALAFLRVPVLDEEQVEVREAAGPRAEVEWRLIAREVAGGNESLIGALEAQLAAEGTALPDPEKGGIRLRRDRFKRVSEVWVRWSVRMHLLESGPGDRHYVLERSRGVIQFGDGIHGKVPPAGAAVLARRYRSGGGAAGNVAAGAINQVAGAIGGLQAVANLKPAAGGADGETLAQARARGPAALRHGDRALVPADYEALAREASFSVARAWALANRDAMGRRAPRPGGVTVQILPRSDETVDQPLPSFALREEVRRYLLTRAPACLAGAGRIQVRGPVYFTVDVEATLAPRRDRDAGPMLDAAKAAMKRFLHPVVGGPEGAGWPPERDLFASDLALVLESVATLDHVEKLTLLVDGTAQPERVRVPAGRVLAAGAFRLSLAAPAIEEGRP